MVRGYANEHTGFTFKYHGSRGLSKSIISSLKGMPSSSKAMWARCAHGQPWLVYKMMSGVAAPLVAPFVAMVKMNAFLISEREWEDIMILERDGREVLVRTIFAWLDGLCYILQLLRFVITQYGATGTLCEVVREYGNYPVLC